jgi:hypothetical protein
VSWLYYIAAAADIVLAVVSQPNTVETAQSPSTLPVYVMDCIAAAADTVLTIEFKQDKV